MSRITKEIIGVVMLAVIETGGKQYKVSEGSFVAVEKLPLEVGAKFDLHKVSLVDCDGKIKVGTPFIEGVCVSTEVVAQKRRDTVLVFKKSRRKNYRRKNGHRQPITILKVNGIKC